MRMRGRMDVPSDITIVFFKLMVILKSLQALAKRPHRFCKCTPEWATRAASSAYSNSRISSRLVLVLARSRERLNSPQVLRVWSMIPSSCGKACAWRAEKNMPNSAGARTQPFLTPLQIGKVLDMEPSHWTLAFMFSWNSARMESSVSRQPNSLSMLCKPDHWLTISKALVRSMKTTYSGCDYSTLFSWSCLSENTMSDVLRQGRKPHWPSGRILSAIWRTLGKRRREKLSRQQTKARCHDSCCNPCDRPCSYRE